VLRAYYTGIVPDTFKADSEVVLTGTMDDQGFHATEMTAKCPSKYDAAPVGRRFRPPRAFGRSVTAWPRSGTTCSSPRSSCALRRGHLGGRGAARSRR
jgi:hypothetical protein